MKIWLASYKGTPKGLKGRIVSAVIRATCKGVYSHCEIVVGDNPFKKPAECISSSGMDGGVRLKTMTLNPDHWDLIEVKVSRIKVEEWMRENIGKKYDFAGTARFVLPFFVREHEDKWFCSEACADMLGFSEPWRFDPCSLHVATMGMK